MNHRWKKQDNGSSMWNPLVECVYCGLKTTKNGAKRGGFGPCKRRRVHT